MKAERIAELRKLTKPGARKLGPYGPDKLLAECLDEIERLRGGMWHIISLLQSDAESWPDERSLMTILRAYLEGDAG